MKTMYKIISMFICFFIGLSSVCLADITMDCMKKISDNQDFQTTMTDNVFKGKETLTEEDIRQAKSKVLGAAVATLLYECPSDISVIAKQPNGKVWIKLNGQVYGLVFKMSDLFAYANIRTGIMIYNNSSLGPGDIIEQSSIPKLYWSNNCSDHIIRDGHNDDAAVNVAGQSIFTEYGGSKNEFFLDFEEGNDRRVFPGLVIMEDHHNGLFGEDIEQLVYYTNVQTAIDKAYKFAKSLKGTACGNQNLSVYVVALDIQKTSSETAAGWGFAASVAGATGIIGAGLAAATASTALAATGSMVLVNTALAAAAFPVAGWIAAGAAATAALLIPFFVNNDSTIENIERVMVIDGPYIIDAVE